ncbi:hypothetical protein [Novipirellula artificiosorum]|uniref:Uncharacterized protein n=1 Tax=Novipirellula artificiosorum TaxID=2528016 RepID=A0A5C6DGK1_9BACT|nr:hypothetical protein [Novipirellula artificiosorum]TWU34947.1 hypothetical protein Poly41_40910 [Novipirellula artificiosorum]
MPSPSLTLRSGLIAKLSVCIIVLLCLAHVTAHLLAANLGDSKYTEQLVEWFGLDEEGNFPAFFSSVLLLVASCQFAVIHALYLTSQSRALSDRKSSFLSKHWLILSAVFLFLTLDEAVQIHEMFDNQSLLSFMNTSGLLAWPWVIVYGVLVAVFVLFFFRFWLALTPRYRRLSFIAASMYVAGAIGGEMIGAAVYTSGQGKSVSYFLIYTLEEVLEMLAITLLIYANNLFISKEFPPPTLKILA